MIGAIKYYYNFHLETIYKVDNKYCFNYQNEKYYLVVFDRPFNDIKSLYELNLEMINRNMLVHEIILNKDKNMVTIIDSIPYILLRVYINEKAKITAGDINNFLYSTTNIKADRNLDRSTWSTLWGQKLDYFEYQISQLGTNFPIIKNSISYFIGMGENAISYVVNAKKEKNTNENAMLTISHKRVFVDDSTFDFYNPTNFILDNRIRDISEYLKSAFYHENNVWPDIYNLIGRSNLSLYELKLFYGRMLFPSFYFDIYEKIMDGVLEEKALLDIIYKTVEYEDFLDDLYNYIRQFTYIPPVDWINKKIGYEPI